MTPPPRGNKNRKPGLTAKGDQRQYVRHSYNDRSQDAVENLTTSDENTLRLYREDSVGGPFPLKLQIVLKVTEKLNQQHIISWLPHGRSFMIHRPREFEEEVMGKFFKQTKLTSFRRQLNLYDFQRITHGRDAGSYYHELFLRGRPLLAKRMVRRKVKGTKIRASSSPDDEPNFYTMPPMESSSEDATNTTTGRGVMDHQDQTMIGAGANHLSALSGLQGASGAPMSRDPRHIRNPESSLSPPHSTIDSLRAPVQPSALYSDLLNSSAAVNQMSYPQNYGRPMENIDYIALTQAIHQRNNFASSSLGFPNNYPPFLHGYDASLLDRTAMLHAAAVDPRLSHFNESLLGVNSHLGAGGNYPNQFGQLSSMLLNQSSLAAGGQPTSTATRILLEQMNQQSPSGNSMQPTMNSNDEKKNAIEQLLLLQRDPSGTSNTMKVEESNDSSKGDSPKKEEHSAVLAL